MTKQKAYVLHTRPYRETSIMVDFFTPDYGLIRCIGRGIKRQMSQGHSLQPFILYHIEFNGDSDLKTLTHYETLSLPLPLQGDQLFSAFYVNEVIQRALRSEADIEDEDLFDAYADVLKSLLNEQIEYALRLFELTLLEHMGQTYQWAWDFKTHAEVEADAQYGFHVEQGMTQVSLQYAQKNPAAAFNGQLLLNLASGYLDDPATLKMTKRLLRLALRPIIGYKPIQARELLMQFKNLSKNS